MLQYVYYEWYMPIVNPSFLLLGNPKRCRPCPCACGLFQTEAKQR